MCVYLMLRVVIHAIVPHTGRAGGIPLALALDLGSGVAWVLPFPCRGAYWSRRCSSFELRPLFPALRPVSHAEALRHKG